MTTILTTLSNEQHLGVISIFVFNCNALHGKLELTLAKSKVAIDFLVWWLRFENKYSVHFDSVTSCWVKLTLRSIEKQPKTGQPGTPALRLKRCVGIRCLITSS